MIKLCLLSVILVVYMSVSFGQLCVSQKSWGYDFRRNAELDRVTFGQYSTELFTREAEKIIANHNTSQVHCEFL